MDINNPALSRKIPDPDASALMGNAAPEATERPDHPLDAPEVVELQRRMLQFYRTELSHQEANRAEMATDEDYYDSIQWTEEELAVMRERNQPPTVYNLIATTINWIIGSEKRGRTDYKILPRRKNDGKAAEKKTALLKYLSDVNGMPFSRSAAFEEAVKAGIGFLEAALDGDDGGEPIAERAESWRNMLWDSTYRQLDMSDCRYMFRTKWVDLDVAQALFPDRAAELAVAAVDSNYYGGQTYLDGDDAMDSIEYSRAMIGPGRDVMTNPRRRVRLMEGWFRRPERVDRLRSVPGRQSDFAGEIYDPEDERHVHAVQNGLATVASSPVMRMHVMIFTTSDAIWFGPSPYRHNKFPFTPIWAYRRSRDGLPYGYIRGIRGIQDDVNKRLSKILHILSTNKVIIGKGAVDDIETFRDEAARADAVLEVEGGAANVVLSADREVAAGHFELLQNSMTMIQQAGGVTDELLARETNAVSGAAITARQEQGSLVTSKVFDNLRLAAQQHGEKVLSLIEQYMTDAKQFRITDMRGNPDYVDINDGLPENDITRTKADFVIDEADWRATMRQAAVNELIELAKTLPGEIVLTVLDLLVENMDIPNRDEIVRRIRQATGQRDPEQTEPTPEDIAAQEAAAKQQAMNDAVAQAALAEQQARADKARADAGLSNARAQHARNLAMVDGVDAMRLATQAAQEVATLPQLVPIADQILQEVGWDQLSVPANLPPLPEMTGQQTAPEQQAI